MSVFWVYSFFVVYLKLNKVLVLYKISLKGYYEEVFILSV